MCPYLATADRIPRRDQDKRLVEDELDLVLVVDDSLAPVPAHSAVHRHIIDGVVEAGLVGGVDVPL